MCATELTRWHSSPVRLTKGRAAIVFDRKPRDGSAGTGYVTSDDTMNVAQWFDYAPYGSVLATTNTGATKAGRQYIGQYTDDSGLSYLNARFYNSGQGQFITEDPLFWSQQNLGDPQSLNPYSYSDDNPVPSEDPSGREVVPSGNSSLVLFQRRGKLRAAV
jgi:RHS repeat-associated protein